MNQFRGHGDSALHGVEIPTGRTEAAVAAERNKLYLTAVGTAVHGTAEGGIAARDHFIYVFYYGFAWM